MDDRRFKAKSGERAVNFTKRFRHADRDAQPQLRDLRRLTRTQNVRPERRQCLRAEKQPTLLARHTHAGHIGIAKPFPVTQPLERQQMPARQFPSGRLLQRTHAHRARQRQQLGDRVTADEIATEAEFFSFGTNDLTQMTFGFSRDDAGKFLGAYYDKKIYENDPFAKLDQVGVGKLVKMAAKMGRETRPDLHLGICGEHGGDPSSVEFCHKVGLDYVSCSPFRVPIARLAAAQAAIKEQQN